MLAALLIFIFAIYENKFYQKENQKESKYFNIFVIFVVSGIFFTLIAFLSSLFIPEYTYNFDFMNDYRYYLYLFFEGLGMFMLNINYINNPKDHTVVNVGMFSTILITPIVVFFLDDILGFNNTLKVSIFNSLENILIYISIYLLISIIYFYPKIKNNHLNKPQYLVLAVISLIIGFYLEVKLIQSNNLNINIYAVSEIVIALFYLVSSLNNERGIKKIINLEQIKMGITYSFYGSLHFIGLAIVPTEIGLLLRRTSQILAAFIVDKKHHPIRDYILIILMISGGLFLVYY